MSDGIKLSETPEVPQETQEVTEARQAVDRATFEPEAALEGAADIKQAEEIEAAVKDAVDAAMPAAEGRPGEGETEEAAVPAADGGRRTGDQGEQSYDMRTDARTGTQTIDDLIESAEAVQEVPPESADPPTRLENQEASSPAAEAESAEAAELQRGDDPQGEAAPSLGEEKSGVDTTTAGAKAIGETSPAGSGLPLDEQTEGSKVEGEVTSTTAPTSATLAEGLSQVSATGSAGSPDAGRMTVEAPSSGAETVMIDTVPLPESPAEEEMSPHPADGSRESITFATATEPAERAADSRAGVDAEAPSDQATESQRDDLDSDQTHDAPVRQSKPEMEDWQSRRQQDSTAVTKPEQENTKISEDSTAPHELAGAVIEEPNPIEEVIPGSDESTESSSDTSAEIQERIDELQEKRSELLELVARLDSEIRKLEDHDFFTGYFEIKTQVSWLTLIENSDGSYTFGSDGGFAHQGSDWQSEIEALRSEGIAAMQDAKQVLQNEISEIDAEIAKLTASLEE